MPITLEHDDNMTTLRTDRTEQSQSISRKAQTTPAGVTLAVGDAGWNPATLTLRVRAGSGAPTDRGGTLAQQTLVQAARATTALHLTDGTIAYVHGLRAVRRKHHGTWWELALDFLARPLNGARGTGEILTTDGTTAITTAAGTPITVDWS